MEIFQNANAPASGGADSSTTSSLNDGGSSSYLVDKFVMDALQLKITPFMLDAYAHEYDETVRTREAHMIEMDTIRNANRQLTAQV